MSDQPWNIDMRGAIISLIDLVPEVGGILSLFTTIFWPPDQPDYMASVKTYVDQRITQAIDQAEVQDCRQLIEGLQLTLNDALKAKANNFPEFQRLLTSAFASTDEFKPKFVDLANNVPQEGIVYLVAFGTLRLAIMREEYYSNYDDSNRPAYRELMVNEINDLIPTVRNARSGAIAWRQSQFYWWDPHAHPPAYELLDQLDSTFKRWYYDDAGKALGLQNAQDDVAYAWNKFAYNIDELIDPYRYWIFFDPYQTQKPAAGRMATYTRSGDFIGGYDTVFSTRDNFLADGPITGIFMWFDTSNNFKGLELFYTEDLKSSGQIGNCQGPSHQLTNTGGMNIASCGGHTDVNGVLNGFWFASRNGAIGKIGGGIGPDLFYYDFTNLAGKDSGYTLAYVEGKCNGSGIAQLSCVWVRPVDWDGEFGQDHQV